MAGKRKAKRVVEELSKPSKWRLQHGGFSDPIRSADPETGTPVAHRRAVDTLGMMLAHGSITPQMHEAGCIFRTLFRSAALDRHAAPGSCCSYALLQFTPWRRVNRVGYDVGTSRRCVEHRGSRATRQLISHSGSRAAGSFLAPLYAGGGSAQGR